MVYLYMGASINYVSMAEGGGGSKILTDAHMGEGVSKMAENVLT